jgi:hypothetical protein
MLQQDFDAMEIFIRNQSYNLLFEIIDSVDSGCKFTGSEMMNIITALINLASENEYFDYVEKNLLEKNKDPLELTLRDLEDLRYIRYVTIHHVELMMTAVKILFEVNEDDNLKEMVLYMIQEMTRYSYFNCLTFGQVPL